MRQEHAVDPQTIAWQGSRLQKRNLDATRRFHERQWRHMFVEIDFPPIVSVPHHFTHGFQAFLQSPFREAVVLTVDGSGDQHCTVVWEGRGENLKPLHELVMELPLQEGWNEMGFCCACLNGTWTAPQLPPCPSSKMQVARQRPGRCECCG